MRLILNTTNHFLEKSDIKKIDFKKSMAKLSLFRKK